MDSWHTGYNSSNDKEKRINIHIPLHDLGECFTGDIPTFVKTDADRATEDALLDQWVKSLPEELSTDISALYKEMDEQKTKEAKVYKALDKLEKIEQEGQ
ncbi:MAG: HD domain-containing protein [Clostridiales bacterium]|nr:HD domain-containing protein [Clostridiales bacterium]